MVVGHAKYNVQLNTFHLQLCEIIARVTDQLQKVELVEINQFRSRMSQIFSVFRPKSARTPKWFKRFLLSIYRKPLPSIWFSTGLQYPFHPLEASLPLLPPFLLHRLSFIYLPLVIAAISPLIWDGLAPPFSHPSPAPPMTRSPCSPGPLTSLHPHPHLLPHLLTSPAVAWPSPLARSLTHSLTLAVNWVICPLMC